jgi:hypothetical protein
VLGVAHFGRTVQAVPRCSQSESVPRGRSAPTPRHRYHCLRERQGGKSQVAATRSSVTTIARGWVAVPGDRSSRARACAR